MNETSPILVKNPSKISWKLFGLGLVILLFDQLSKGLVFAFLPVIDSAFYWYPYGGIAVFHHFAGIEFSINHMTNTGAAWGVFGEYQLLLIVLRMGLIAALCYYLMCFNSHRSWRVPLVMIIAGATGNVLDFFIYGHVVDMLHFVFWGFDFPVFNLADSAITLGIIALFFLSWVESRP